MSTKLNSVLLIEDYKPLRLSLTEHLSEYYHVSSASNGIEALEMIKKHTYDIILLDLMLPFPLDGFSILKILKADERLSYIPVIIISALDNEQKIVQGLEMGANDYLVKPFNEKQLILKINNLLLIKDSILKKLESEIILKTGKQEDNSKGTFESDFRKKFDALLEAEGNNNNLSIKMLAQEMSMSVATLERWVKKIYKTSPKKHMLEIKLMKAEIMLRHKMGSVNEIAYLLGFNSVSYFCTCFKQKFSKTPYSVMKESHK
ncbi:MAG: response regulator [Bacteroidota bacterium]|nr:response regulator [Bacteroidota bacterium]